MAKSDASARRAWGIAIDDGRILAVEFLAKLRRQYTQAQVEDCGDVVLLPGLVNAHLHLELTFSRSEKSPANLAQWLLGLAQTHNDPQRTLQAVRAGIAQCLGFGVTCVGDISRNCQTARSVLAKSSLRGVSFGEILAMAQNRRLLDQRLDAAIQETTRDFPLRIGLSPHAPYSIEPDGYRRCLAMARQHHMPLTTHLAESPDETSFLAQHAGPLRELWRQLDRWDDAVPRFDGGPIRFANSLGLLQAPTLLAHVNYCDDQELEILAAGRASVIFCPRTHRYFGHPPHRWRDMLAAGINVAVGTDSCASSPDLNLVDDLRLIHHQYPDVKPAEVWALATWRAAAALGEIHAGSLAPQMQADIVAFPVQTPDPLREILAEAILPTAIWIGGRQMADNPREPST